MCECTIDGGRCRVQSTSMSLSVVNKVSEVVLFDLLFPKGLSNSNSLVVNSSLLTSFVKSFLRLVFIRLFLFPFPEVVN